MTATGCRASRRGAPGPQGALRPLGLRSDAGIHRFGLALAARRGDAPRGRLPTPLRSRRRRPANGCIGWLPEVSTISPRRAPSALAAGSRTLPQGRLRKPSARHPYGLARYALRRTNRRSSGLPAAMILPCARAQGRANRSLRLAPAGRWTARYGSLPPGDGPLATARSHQSVSKAGRLVCMQCCGFHSHC